MPFVGDRLTVRNSDIYTPASEIHHKPVNSGTSDADAVYVRQWSTGGMGKGVVVHSDNPDAPAVRVQGSGPLLQLYDASDVLRFEIGNTGSITAGALAPASLAVTGAATVGTTLGVTGATTLTGALSGSSATFSTTLGVTGATTLSSTLGVTGAATLSSTLAVTGTSTLTGNVTMTNNATVGGTFGVTGVTTLTGALVVDDANFSVLGTNKGYRFRPLGARLDCEATGSDWMFSVFSGTNFDGSQRTYLRLESGVTLAHACGTWIFTDTGDSAAVHTLDGSGNKLGFHGATSIAQQTVTGSKASGAALADLLTKLANTGLIADGTSA